jgi:signal transduction histidine kinase
MRVLAIEDEPDLLNSLTKALREDGYAVDGAADGEDGLYKAESYDYDAIVLDIMLPRLDGWELLLRLRKTKKTPVLMLTARDAVRDRVRGLDAGQEPLKRERFDLARVARECVELVRPLAAERGIQIHSHVPPLECLGDAERIGQVVTNLLTNAIHFNRDQGEVRLAARTEGDLVLLTVADTGQGIPAEDVPHIFERFYRVDQSRSRVQGRSGLGLAICKAIVDAHGGSMEVSSQPGVGSTFTVKLPLR